MQLYDFLQELRLDEIEIEREKDTGREIAHKDVLGSDMDEYGICS